MYSKNVTVHLSNIVFLFSVFSKEGIELLKLPLTGRERRLSCLTSGKSKPIRESFRKI